jgi:hypothetical protein
VKLANLKNEVRGQAMVEFVIMLTVFMVMISGMLYFFRLHLYQFWADQEARYLGFEQTWVPKAYYDATGIQPVTALEGDAIDFSRPTGVTGLGVTRDEGTFGSMSDLIPGVFSRNERPLNDWSIEDVEVGGFVPSAFANQRDALDMNSDPQHREDRVISPSILPALDNVIQDRLHKGGFGEKFCSAIRTSAEKYGVRAGTNSLFDIRCPQTLEGKLSHYIAKETNVPEIVRSWSDLVSDGENIDSSIREITQNVVADGFYSFFYDEVKSKFNDAGGELVSHQVSTAIAAVDSSVLRMLTDLRYIGSSAAIAAILAEEVAISGWSINNRNSDTEKTFEEAVQSVLHIDASDILPVIGDGYLLNPTYLPVPPKFGPLAPGLFSGTMRSVLSLDDGMVGSHITESVKKVTVTYDSANGVFPAAERRFRTGIKLQTSFVIDTNPWHIPRRENGTGNYRDKGEEFDQVSEPTEEGQLRRRVSGLWLFPTPPDAFFDPLLSFAGLDALTDLVDAFRPLGSFLSQIKSFLTNNPLFELSNTLSEIPLIGSLFPKFPVWPVVRPDAYPNSVEMKDDKKMGSSREFEDYIDEQREFNPAPDPEFN